MEVTTWVKRRQGDTRAVTQVKPNEPRDKRPDADTLEHVEGQEKAAAKGKAAVLASSVEPREFARKAAVLAEHCEAVGRDPTSILYTWQCQTVSIADSAAEAQALAERTTLYQNSSKDGLLIGTPEQIAERIAEYVDVGVRHFILRFADFPETAMPLRFAAEIAPKLRS